MRRLTFLVVACLLLFVGCAKSTDTTTTDPSPQASDSIVVHTPPPSPTPAPTPAPTPTPEPTATPDPWTAEEVDAIARTLSGECYEDKPQDKRLVAEVILNRVTDGRWGDTVIEVITAKSQFFGYWQPSRDVSDNDREIAIGALRDWYANDCAAISEYLFFEAGPNRENVFRTTF